MKPSQPFLSAIVPLAMALGLPLLASAEDKLPDERAARAFLASGDFTVGGWWKREIDDRATEPETLISFSFSSDLTACTITWLEESVEFGKGSLTEGVLNLAAAEDGSMAAASVKATVHNKTVSASLKPLADGKWQVDLYTGGRASSHTVDSREKALELIEQQEPWLGSLFSNSAIPGREFQSVADRMRLSAVTVKEDGKIIHSWRAVLDDRVAYTVAFADARLLRIEEQVFRLLPSTPDAALALRKRMAETNRPPLEVFSVDDATITFHEKQMPSLPSNAQQAVSSDLHGHTVVITGDGSGSSTEPPDEDLRRFRDADSTLTVHPKFQALANSWTDADPDDPIAFCLAVSRVVEQMVKREFESKDLTPAAALEAGKGGDPARMGLILTACRQANIVSREVHGFIVHPDCVPVLARRHLWIELLVEGEWRPLDLRVVPTEDEDGRIFHPGISNLHVKVCHGSPDKARAALLESRPAVTVEWQTSKAPRSKHDPGRPSFIRPKVKE